MEIFILFSQGVLDSSLFFNSLSISFECSAPQNYALCVYISYFVRNSFITLKSRTAFLGAASALSFCIFLPAGFLTVSVVFFFMICLLQLDRNILRQFKLHKILVFPIFLFFLNLFWVLFSENLGDGLSLVFKKIPLLLLPLSFILINKEISRKELHIILGVFLAACLLASFVCYGYAFFNIIQHKSIMSDQSGEYYFSYVNLTNPVKIDPIYLSLFCNFACVIALQSPFIKSPWLRGLIVLYLSVFIFMIASKMGIIALAAVALQWTISRTHQRIPSLILVISLLALFVLGIYKLPFLSDRFLTSTQFNYAEEDGGKWNSTTFRLAIWSCAKEAIEMHPLLGCGTGGGQKVLEGVYHEKNFVWGLKHQYNAHNEFLSTQLDLGIVGLLLVVAMLIIGFIQSIKSKDALTLSFFCIIFLYFLIETVLARQKGVVFFSFFFSLLLWLPKKNKNNVPLIA